MIPPSRSISALLYDGAIRAGLGRRTAALLAGGAAALFGGWLAGSAVLAGRGWYHAQLGHGVPWLPVAVLGFFAVLMGLARIPAAARALAAPGMARRLEVPHTFRVAGVAFLITMALGHLPALFAVPAGLGDMATGIGATLILLRPGHSRRDARLVNAFGLGDLILALVLGGLTAYQLVPGSSAGSAVSLLPLALVPTVEVPLLIALHLTSLSALAKSASGVAATTTGAAAPAAA